MMSVDGYYDMITVISLASLLLLYISISPVGAESWWEQSAIANSAHLSVYLVVKMLKIGKIVCQFVVAERWSPQVMFVE